MYFIDNEHDGLRGQHMLVDTIAGNAKELSGSKTSVHYLGMAREAGNSPMYVIEMAFYQNVMYPDLYDGADQKIDYKTLFDEFFQMFLPDIYENKALYEKVEPGCLPGSCPSDFLYIHPRTGGPLCRSDSWC